MTPNPRSLVLVALLAALAPALPPVAAAAAADSAADAEVAFAFGLAAYHRGDFDEAAELLGRAAAAAPDDGTARYWLGLALLARGDGDGAAREIEAALGAAEPPRVDRQRVRGDLERARRAARGEAAGETPPPAATAGPAGFGDVPPWELELSASYGDDSNPLLLADGALALAPGGGVFDGPQSDAVAGFGLRAAVTPLRARRGWTLSLVGEGDAALYDELDFLDYRRLAGSLHLVWGDDPAGFVAGPLGFSRAPLGHRRAALLLQAGVADEEVDGEAYRTTTSAAAALVVRQGGAAASRLSLAYHDQEYDADGSGPFEASGTVTEAGLDQTFYLGRRDRFLRFGVRAGERDAGAAFDASRTGGRAELALPLGAAWTLTLAGGVEQVDFDGVESNPAYLLFPVDEARDDTVTRLGAALSWAATPRLLVTARAGRTDRDSDVGPVAAQFFDLDYERTVVAVGVRWFLLGGGAR